LEIALYDMNNNLIDKKGLKNLDFRIKN